MSSFTVQLMLAGHKNVGKKSFRQQYITPPNQTSGIENIDGNLSITLRLSPTTQPHFFQYCLSGIQGVLLVFDLTNRLSFTSVDTWIAAVSNRPSFLDPKKAVRPKVLVGNRCDLVDQREVGREEAEQLAASHGMKYFETTTTDYESVRVPIVEIARMVVEARETLMTALQRASSSGDVIGVEKAVREQGEHVDKYNDHQCTAVHFAAKNGHVSVIEALVRLGSKAIDIPDKEGWTPMTTAAYYGQIEVIEALVRLGSNAIDTPNNDGATPLHEAASHGQVAVIELLIRSGSNVVDTPDNDGRTPLFVAASNGRALVIETLIRLGSQAIDTPDSNSRTPLHAAALNGHVSVIDTLVRLGSKAIDTPFSNAQHRPSYTTPIGIAALLGRVNVIEALVRLGSQAIDTPDNHGCTPMHLAASGGKVSVIEALVRLGSQAIDTRDDQGWTPLIKATFIGRPRAIETLVGLGSRELNTPDEFFHPLTNVASYFLPKNKTTKVLKALGVSHPIIDNQAHVELNDDEVLEVRYRVYFSRSLSHHLLSALHKVPVASRR